MTRDDDDNNNNNNNNRAIIIIIIMIIIIIIIIIQDSVGNHDVHICNLAPSSMKYILPAPAQ